MKIKYFILSFLLLSANLLFADGIKFTASASKTEVGTGEQFEITFSVNGNGDDFRPPNITDFQILSGPNVSTSMESFNGNTTVSTSYSYILMAVKVGEFIIGPATIVVNGRRLSTLPFKIKVVKGRPVPQNNAQQNNPNNNIPPLNTSDLSKLLFIRAVVDKNNVYDGQQITVSYRLYTRVGIDDSQPDKLPDLNGFWSEDVKRPQQVQWSTETYKGQQYRVADIKQSILFPERDGNLTIDPLSMVFIVQRPVVSRDPMDRFFGGSYQQVKYKAQSVPVTIHVKPLPEEGKPVGFAGAVGKFTIDAGIDKTEVKTNDAINYKVKITGSGNIKLFKPLMVEFPIDFEKYDPKVTDTVTEDINGVSGSRIYNYLLIPRHQGDYTIEPLKFSYFNPNTGKYITLESQPFHVKVNKGAAESNVTAFSGEEKEDLKILGKDVRYIKTEGDLSNADDMFFGSIGYWLLIVLGPVLCAIAFAYRNKVRKDNSDVVKVKSKRAGKIAAKHLANAQQQLTAKNTKAFYEAIFKGLYGYLGDKLNIVYANLDRETIASTLRAKSVEEQLIKRLLDTLDLCEMARYAPVSHISEQEAFDKANGIINDIENEI
jgi:BatD DUF11 like domain